MKQIILALVLATINSICNAQTVTLKLSDVVNDTAIITVLDKTMARAISNDTVVRRSGKFKYNYTGDKAHAAMVFLKTVNGQARKQIYLVPGDKGKLTGTVEHSKWSGKGFYADYAELKAATFPIEIEYGEAVEDVQAKMKTGANRDSLRQVARLALKELSRRLQTETLNFIRSHPSSGASAVCLSSLEDLETGLSLIDPSLKYGIFSEFIEIVESRVERLKAQHRAKAQKDER